MAGYIEQYHREAVEKLFKLLSHRNVAVTVAAARAIGNIARFAPLPIPDQGMDVDNNSESSSSATPKNDQGLTKQALVAKLGSMLKSPTTERRLTERIATALGIATPPFAP